MDDNNEEVDLPQESESVQQSSNSKNNLVNKKIQKRLSKSIKENAVKNSAIRAILPILPYVIIVIVILIVVIGVILFFLTMPGMVMEQAKDLAKTVGNAILSWFGEDSTTQVENAEIFDTLDYLEQMGYDLKGDGFLTEYVGDSDEGVERDDDGKISDAKSEFITTYLISDNYVYTIKNFNPVSNSSGNSILNGILAIGQHLASFLSSGDTNRFWSRGMIAIYHDEGKLGNKGKFYGKTELGSIHVNLEQKELEIKRGWFNNSMKYSLDGWTGRYGMPIDFLIAVHTATMMPDLAYDMVKNFETEIDLLLHPVGGGEKDDNTAIGYYKIGDTYKSYDEFEEHATSGITGSLNAWRISEEEAKDIMDTFGMEKPEGCSCTEGANQTCSTCRDYLQKIYDYLKKSDVANLEIYQPYISQVSDHWYRDVYFVAKPTEEFVDYDYDYESVMKERWTLYETYGSENPDKEGEYKLYEINDDGTYTNTVFDGTAEEASAQGKKVAKKARTKQIVDMADDLSWEEVDNKLAAYKVDSVTEEDFQAVYPDVTEDDPDYEIKKNVYICIKTTGNITQVGEGQRTETNPTIKKLFLQNRYFKYDGSGETAEVITALRKKIKSDGYYGPVKGEDSEGKNVDYTNKTVTIDGKTYEASKYSGEVSLNQDALNAFSMLENEHTLDSDYIYRDFKELIVELGYFEKEELTDETPRLLQFLIPDVGSYCFPSRALDKNEHEYGTMIHSKGDLLANKKNTLRELLKGIEKATSEGETGEETGEISVSKANREIEQKNILKHNNNKINRLAKIDVTTDVNMSSMITVGAAGDSTVSPEEVSVEQFLEAAAKVHTDLETNKFTYLQSAGDQTNYESALNSGKHTDCSAYVSWVLQEVGIFPKTLKLATGTPQLKNGMYGDEILSKYLLTKEEAGELQPGDILISSNHVQINGEGNVQYNAGSTESIQSPPHAYIPDFYTHIIRLPFSGSSASNQNQYEGYSGNEAVVSPVTGILLEYGTYDGVEKDSVSGEVYRTNIDLKYGTGILNQQEGATTQSTGNVNTTIQEKENTKIQVDKVGYAKILVLDKENYKKIEQKLLGETRWSSSFLTNKGKYKDINDLSEEQINDEGNPWTDLDKTLYGYKEFAKNYEEFGIAGNVVYVEGFSAELPDENFNAESDSETASPDGEDLNISSFENVGLSSFSGGNISNEDDLLTSLYEKDDEYKLASKRATEKLNAENIVKEEASPSLYINGLRVIKEGTVIGRTITDRELIVDYRNENYEDYRKSSDTDNDSEENEEENTDKVIGNYIRIIMRDLDKTVVENVEDYMKLDEGEGQKKGLDTEFPEYFLFWLGVLEEGACEGQYDLGDSYGTTVLNDGAGNTTAFGLTKAVANVGKVPEMYPDFGAHLASGKVPKQEAQDVFVLVLEAAREAIIGENASGGMITDPSGLAESELDALCELHHASPSECQKVCEIYNSKKSLTVEDFESHWGTNENYGSALRSRAHCRGILATEERYLLYNANQRECDFSSETPWTDFCGGTPSSQLYTLK